MRRVEAPVAIVAGLLIACGGGTCGPPDGGALLCLPLDNFCTLNTDCCSNFCDPLQGICAPDATGNTPVCAGDGGIPAFDVCSVTGFALVTDASCDPCVQQICAADATCCPFWTPTCSQMARQDCVGRCP